MTYFITLKDILKRRPRIFTHTVEKIWEILEEKHEIQIFGGLFKLIL